MTILEFEIFLHDIEPLVGVISVFMVTFHGFSRVIEKYVRANPYHVHNKYYFNKKLFFYDCNRIISLVLGIIVGFTIYKFF
jgi:hypothetical protein